MTNIVLYLIFLSGPSLLVTVISVTLTFCFLLAAIFSILYLHKRRKRETGANDVHHQRERRTRSIRSLSSIGTSLAAMPPSVSNPENAHSGRQNRRSSSSHVPASKPHTYDESVYAGLPLPYSDVSHAAANKPTTYEDSVYAGLPLPNPGLF